MKGKEVFKFAVNASTTEVEALLSELGMSKSQVNYYMVHQANQRIIDAIKKYLEEPDEKFPVNISDHGNSSSASCAILLDECNRRGMFQREIFWSSARLVQACYPVLRYLNGKNCYICRIEHYNYQEYDQKSYL